MLGAFSSLDMAWKWRNVPAPVLNSLVPRSFVETLIGYRLVLSSAQMRKARPHCFRLLTQLMRCAFFLAAASAGSSRAARMARTAMITSKATRVKPGLEREPMVEFMPGNMFLIPKLTSHYSAELMHRCRFKNYSALPFLKNCLAWHGKRFTPMATHLSTMKKNHPFNCVPVLVLLGLIAILNYGCGKKPAPGAELSPGGGPGAPAVVSAEKTSFAEVTSQLDPGGNFYLYLGTAQWLDGLSAKVGAWRQTFAAMPNLKPEDTANVNKAFDLVTSLIKDSGVEDVSGVGMSSVEIEKGMFRNKAMLHHYPGKGDGFLWKLAGKGPHPLTGLDLLPPDTALAIFSDADLPLLWTVAQKEVTQANLPQAQAWMDQLPVQFEQKTKVKWDTFLNSLGGEFGFVMTLDPSNNIPVPMPGGALEIPSPGLLLVIKVNDDTIFNRIDAELKSNPQVISVDQPGLKMRTMPVPLPLPIALRPTAATSGGYLFIASSDALINDALAVKSGQQPGLKSTAEFKHVSQGVPDQGNQFCYLSQRFAETMMKVQQQVMNANAKTDPQTAK